MIIMAFRLRKNNNKKNNNFRNQNNGIFGSGEIEETPEMRQMRLAREKNAEAAKEEQRKALEAEKQEEAKKQKETVIKEIEARERMEKEKAERERKAKEEQARQQARTNEIEEKKAEEKAKLEAERRVKEKKMDQTEALIAELRAQVEKERAAKAAAQQKAEGLGTAKSSSSNNPKPQYRTISPEEMEKLQEKKRLKAMGINPDEVQKEEKPAEGLVKEPEVKEEKKEETTFTGVTGGTDANSAKLGETGNGPSLLKRSEEEPTLGNLTPGQATLEQKNTEKSGLGLKLNLEEKSDSEKKTEEKQEEKAEEKIEPIATIKVLKADEQAEKKKEEKKDEEVKENPKPSVEAKTEKTVQTQEEKKAKAVPKPAKATQPVSSTIIVGNSEDTWGTEEKKASEPEMNWVASDVAPKTVKNVANLDRSLVDANGDLISIIPVRKKPEKTNDVQSVYNIDFDDDDDEIIRFDADDVARNEAKTKAEEAARVAAENAKRKAEEAARKRAMQEAEKFEEARKAKEEEKRKAAEEAVRKAEERQRRIREAEKQEKEKQRVEEAIKRKAAEEARLKAAEERRLQAEEEAKRKAEEERRKNAEEARKAAEEMRLAKEEAKRKKAEEAVRKAEEEQRRIQLAEMKAKELEAAKNKNETNIEEEKRKAVEEAKRKAEEEAKRRAEEEAKRKAEEEALKAANDSTQEFMLPNGAEQYLGKYVSVNVIADQILQTMKAIHSNPAEPRNVVILGQYGFGTASIAEDFARSFYALNICKNKTIAKIKAGALNRTNISASIAKLQGGCLVIENAGSMTNAKLNEIYQILCNPSNDVVVIMTGQIETLSKLFKENPMISAQFKHIIQTHRITDMDVLSIAKNHAIQLGYPCRKDAENMLRRKMREVESGNLDRVLQIVNNAATKAHSREMSTGEQEQYLVAGDFE